VTTSYNDRAPLDEYGMTAISLHRTLIHRCDSYSLIFTDPGLIRQPIWGQSSGDACCNHQVLCNNTTRRSVSQQVIMSILLNLGCCNSIQLFFYLFVYVMKACDEHCMLVSNQAYVFEEKGGGCAAFLVNNDQKNTATVAFRNLTFELLPQLISILPDRGKIIFSSLFKISESGITETENDRDLVPCDDLRILLIFAASIRCFPCSYNSDSNCKPFLAVAHDNIRQ